MGSRGQIERPGGDGGAEVPQVRNPALGGSAIRTPRPMIKIAGSKRPKVDGCPRTFVLIFPVNQKSKNRSN